MIVVVLQNYAVRAESRCLVNIYAHKYIPLGVPILVGVWRDRKQSALDPQPSHAMCLEFGGRSVGKENSGIQLGNFDHID